MPQASSLGAQQAAAQHRCKQHSDAAGLPEGPGALRGSTATVMRGGSSSSSSGSGSSSGRDVTARGGRIISPAGAWCSTCSGLGQPND
jgi:hypothetical protein